MTRHHTPLPERFWPKVIKTESCWTWAGARTSRNYGCIGEGAPSRKTLLAHRVSYELTHGPIASGLVIDHKCHNTMCVNPEHLQAVPQKANSENRGVLNSDNTSGIRGVSKHKKTGKYEARVRHDGKLHYAGIHMTIEAAQVAVVDMRNRLYTNNLKDLEDSTTHAA